MPANTYGYYAYFNNMNDTPNENHNNLILNQISDFHITSPFNLCSHIFESFAKKINKMIKCMKSHVEIVTWLSYSNV